MTGEPIRLSGIKACVFDAYNTLFDVASVTEACRDELGALTEPLTRAWRQKTLEYTWIRTLMGAYVDFWQVSGDALDHALAGLGLARPTLRARLMQQNLMIRPFPDSRQALSALRQRGFKSAILSNGTQTMLTGAINTAAIRPLVEHVLSVEEVRVYKPHPATYQLAVDRLGFTPTEICFISGNGWDVAGAGQFGLKTVWVNRTGAEPERLPARPHLVIGDLAVLVDHLEG